MERKFSAGKFLLMVPLAAAAIIAIGFVVMYLWNTVLAEAIPVNVISFWQALGIFILAKILFGFRGGKGHGGPPFWWNKQMRRKMRNMSPEEREKFKEEMCRRMSFWHAAADHCSSPFNKNEENFNNNPSDASK